MSVQEFEQFIGDLADSLRTLPTQRPDQAMFCVDDGQPGVMCLPWLGHPPPPTVLPQLQSLLDLGVRALGIASRACWTDAPEPAEPEPSWTIVAASPDHAARLFVKPDSRQGWAELAAESAPLFMLHTSAALRHALQTASVRSFEVLAAREPELYATG